VQEPLFKPESDWQLPDLNKLPDWTNAKRVGFDTETHDDRIGQDLGPGFIADGEVVGVSFCIEDDRPYYLPVGHLGGDNLPKDKVFQYLADQSRNFKGVLVGANLKYDLGYMRVKHGINFDNVSYYGDVQIAEPLIDELPLTFNLNAIAKRHGLEPKDEILLLEAAKMYDLMTKKKPKTGWKGNLWKLPARYVGPYAEYDAQLPLKLLRKQERMLENRGLWDIYRMESKLLIALLRMTIRGVRIDFEQLNAHEAGFIKEEKRCYQEIKDQTGFSFDFGEISVAAAIGRLFEKIGLPIERTATNKICTNVEFTDKHKDNPIVQLVTACKKANNYRTMFIESIRKHAIGDRIHSTFNQMKGEDPNDPEGTKGAAYGRLSSSNPNIQQQPKRGALAKTWRRIYLPDEGKMWVCADYSGQEPRWAVDRAVRMHRYLVATNKGSCPSAIKLLDAYQANPRLDFHQQMADVTGLVRDYAKQIFLGKLYNMGGARYCHGVGLPTMMKECYGKMLEVAGPEGDAQLRKFDQMAPFAKQLAKFAQATAEDRGYVMTALGRHCHFPIKERQLIHMPNGDEHEKFIYDWTSKALNRVIQGSAADQAKMAIVTADEAGIPIQLQVHDEIDFSSDSEEEIWHLHDLMVDAVKMLVPTAVDVEVGKNWADIKQLERKVV